MLENNLVKLRALEPRDLDVLFKWENDETIWQVSNTLAPYSRYILKKYIESSKADIYEAKQLRLMIEAKRDNEILRPIGIIDIFDFEPFHSRAGLGILIGDKVERGKSYASTALEITLDYVFNVLQFNQLYCNISETNEISLKLFQKFGFEIIGRKKRWTRIANNQFIDEFLLQKINPYL